MMQREDLQESCGSTVSSNNGPAIAGCHHTKFDFSILQQLFSLPNSENIHFNPVWGKKGCEMCEGHPGTECCAALAVTCANIKLKTCHLHKY